MATKAVASSSSSSAVASMRTARACDVCANRSAFWYCAADEAYLCTACDTQVHSANAVSLRHERVRLAPNCIPKKLAASSHHLVPEDALLADPSSSPRKRFGRPYAHHLRKLTRLSTQLASSSSRDVKEEELNHHHHSSAELELFDFLDADEFLNDGNQEVPSLSTGVDKSSPCCSSDLEFMSSDDQEGDVHSADSLAACFKGKAAHSQTVIVSDTDQSLVPDDAATAPADTNVDLAVEDGFLFPGDIPGLDVGFDSFVPEMDLVDDFSLSFDLAFQDGMDVLEGDSNASAANSETTGVAAETHPTETSPHNFLAGPFAKFFAQKRSTTDSQLDLPMDPEGIKREAKAMLQCCREGEDEAQKLVPSLQLNITDILATWSHREEPWILGPMQGSDDSTSSGSDDAGLVPDMDGDRDARVLRYKEKRRTRLFSKTIRYEVRKLNAERRPRMKGRFVKRTTATATSS